MYSFKILAEDWIRVMTWARLASMGDSAAGIPRHSRDLDRNGLILSVAENQLVVCSMMPSRRYLAYCISPIKDTQSSSNALFSMETSPDAIRVLRRYAGQHITVELDGTWVTVHLPHERRRSYSLPMSGIKGRMFCPTDNRGPGAQMIVDATQFVRALERVRPALKTDRGYYQRASLTIAQDTSYLHTYHFGIRTCLPVEAEVVADTTTRFVCSWAQFRHLTALAKQMSSHDQDLHIMAYEDRLVLWNRANSVMLFSDVAPQQRPPASGRSNNSIRGTVTMVVPPDEFAMSKEHVRSIARLVRAPNNSPASACRWHLSPNTLDVCLRTPTAELSHSADCQVIKWDTPENKAKAIMPGEVAVAMLTAIATNKSDLHIHFRPERLTLVWPATGLEFIVPVRSPD